MSKIKSLIMGVMAVLLFAVVPVAVAQNSGDSGNGLQLSPTRTDMSLLPGESKEFSISIKNLAKGPIRVESTINDFESDGVTGNPKIIVVENRQVPTSLKNYVQGLGKFDINADETKDVKLTVNVPSDIPPGAYFGAVRFTVIPREDGTVAEGTQVSLNASVASLLFVEVSGDIKQQMQIENVNICDDALTQSSNSNPETASQGGGLAQNCEKNKSLFFKSPTLSSIKIANQGNGFLKPFGRVAISRGGTEVYAYELSNSDPRGVVLPDSTRVFSNKIEGVNKFGKYTVLASLSYGDGGEVLTHTVSFWYLPAWTPVAIVVILILLIVLAFFIYKKLGKRRKK